MKIKKIGLVFVILLLSSCADKFFENRSADQNSIYQYLIDKSLAYHHRNVLLIRPDAINVEKDDRLAARLRKEFPENVIDVEEAMNDLSAKKNENLLQFMKDKRLVFERSAKYQISSIGFNQSNTVAIVYVDDNVLPRAGSGSYYIFMKLGSEWKMTGSIMTWIS